MLARMRRRALFVGVLLLAACKKINPAATDAGANTAVPSTNDLAWDGPFGVARGDKGVVAVVGTTGRTIVVDRSTSWPSSTSEAVGGISVTPSVNLTPPSSTTSSGPNGVSAPMRTPLIRVP